VCKLLKDELTTVVEDSARGSFFLISGTALSTVIMAIASILIARLLGPDLYGQYTLALVVPQLLFIFTDLGINNGVIKFTASLRAKGEIYRMPDIIKYGLLLKASTGLAIFIINYTLADLFAAVFLQRPDLAFYIRISSIAVAFQVISTTTTSAFVGLDKAEYNALTLNIQAIAKTVTSIALVLIGLSVAGALMGYVASYIIGAAASLLILFFLLRKSRTVKNEHSPLDELKTLVRYGAPLYLSLLLIGFIPLYQNLLLAIFTTDADIGNYKAATNFATLITVVTIPITTALLPAFSKLDASATEKIKTFLKLVNKYTTILVLPITVLIILFSNHVVEIIYGSTFQSAPLFLATHSLLYFLVGFGYLTLTSFFNGLGETKTTLKISSITFLVLAILSPILTSTYGVLGMIIAFLVANIAGTALSAYIARSSFKIEFDTKLIAKVYLVAILSGLPSIALLYFLPHSQLFNVVAGGLLYIFVYMTLAPITRIVNSTELQTASRILQKIKPLTPVTTPLLKYLKKISSYLEP